MRTLLSALLSLACGLLMIEHASAQDSDASQDTQAREHFEEARSAYESGRFRAALEGFEDAYRLSPRPELLFNIGQSNDRLGQLERAAEGYEAYLAEIPEAENRAFVTSRIRVIREQLSASAQPEDRPASDAPTPLGPIVLLSIAGATGIGGLITGISAQGISSDIDGQCPTGRCPESLRSDVESMQTLAVTTDILLGVSLGAAIAGFTWLILSGGGDETPAVSLSCDGFGCSGVARLRF